MTDGIAYDPFSDDVMRDPWPFYAELRREAPVFYLEKYDTWFLSRFEDIRESTVNDVFTAERGVTPEMVLLKADPPPDPVFSMLDLPRRGNTAGSSPRAIRSERLQNSKPRFAREHGRSSLRCSKREALTRIATSPIRSRPTRSPT